MDLEAYLKENKIWHNFTEKPLTIHTRDAARLTGIALERLTKSLIFLVDAEPVVVIIPGNRKASMEKLKKLFMTKDVSLVPFENASEYSGYEPGGTPPLHHKNVKKTIIDRSLVDYATIYGGGGSRTKIVELKPEDIIRLTDATIADVVE
ncbi:MAG: aminoacyl-tRNA deacylase [Candidatus Aenigmarchaeota archaeon]|nr:aminoacyl-tRNA deacylase [Candidatus Aenigmarchaeota archaeon]